MSAERGAVIVGAVKEQIGRMKGLVRPLRALIRSSPGAGLRDRRRELVITDGTR